MHLPGGGVRIVAGLHRSGCIPYHAEVYTDEEVIGRVVSLTPAEDIGAYASPLHAERASKRRRSATGSTIRMSSPSSGVHLPRYSWPTGVMWPRSAEEVGGPPSCLNGPAPSPGRQRPPARPAPGPRPSISTGKRKTPLKSAGSRMFREEATSRGMPGSYRRLSVTPSPPRRGPG